MQRVFTLLLSLYFTTIFFQQTDYYITNNFLANGYDVVSYFKGKAEKGNNEFIYRYDGILLKFKTKAHQETFILNPKKYLPQYGGYCAYAMADMGEKVSINPKTYEIRNGKLYLFYNAFFNNTLTSWIKEDPNKLIKIADENWKNIKHKK